MQPTSEGNLLEIIDLAHTLRQEQLFIIHEQAAFTTLNETLTNYSSSVAQLAWICAQHRQNLNDLILSRPEAGPSVCCQRANRLESTKFLDAFKVKDLKYQHILAYIELFHYLHRSPYLLAQSLAAADQISKMTTDQMNSVVHTIANALYGSAIHSKDVEMVLQLLRELIEIQIVVSENPRRMLRTGSSAFSRLYHHLHESLFSSKIFLTAALHEPVMKVLIESDTVLDMDPNKAIVNFSNKERLKRFGVEGSSEYNENIKKYHEETINKLYLLATQFIDNLTRNWSLFPSTLRWLVQTMYHQLKQAHIKDKDINEIITDMVFTHFICPAVVSPDIFGISDAHISEAARFNLIQIGQILQMLALQKHQEVDPKFHQIYQKFEVNAVADLLEQLFASDSDACTGVVAIRSQQSDFERSKVLLTQSELNNFIEFLRIVLDNDELIISGEDRRKLSKILDQLPDKFQTIVNGDTQQSAVYFTQEHGSRTKQSLINLGKTTKNKLARTMSLNISSANNDIDETSSSNQNGALLVSPNHNSSLCNANNSNARNCDEVEDVLMFPISVCDDSKLQLLTEEEVLKMNSIGEEIITDPILTEESVEKLDKVDTEFHAIGPAMRSSHGKNARFSLSQDDASVGNSDNLEAVSEAPSNHSVTSSLELEENDQNDNLSDMISANVSGRGTPNISGRDTPSSQVTDENVANHIPTPQMDKIINKARSDIEDKFCKFEIKKLIEGDETISIISDTWSTDVLASDSETLDQNEKDRNFSTPLIPSAVVLPGDNNFDPLSSSKPQSVGNYLDATETRSESAWSTDVLASDSEKLAEVDTDDNLSITAKSDITDTGRSEGELGRDQDFSINNDQNQTPDSPFFAPRVPNVNFRGPDSPEYSRRCSETPFYNATSTFEELPKDPARISSPFSSLARSSSRTTNQFTGENSFQQNYKSSVDKNAFLTTSGRMKRQNSAESSISNQSSSMEDAFGIKTKSDKNVDYRRKSKDLIDFTDFNEGATGIDKKIEICEAEDRECYRNSCQKYSEESVIHRRISSEQRNASFDGRRNGILDFKSSNESARRVQSLNYENHELINLDIKKSLQITANPIGADASLTDDIKSQQNLMDELLLIQKTEDLTLSCANNAATDQSPTKPSKSTGAIPKSISFDSSADKSERNSIRRMQDPLRVHGSSFFHKIKQGFKNRRGNKIRLNDDLIARNVSFGNCTSFDSTECEINGTRQGENGFSDITEDILAKYRRKVSTSSETTNSDSTGGSCAINRTNLENEARTPNGLLPDKALAFINAKKKVRAVLSSTDLHSGDFRHTTCSNASSLSTYLQIQLAQALNLQNFQQISYVSEAIRCLSLLDRIQHQKIIEELQGDILRRQSYLQYLMRYRQNLLSIIENISQLETRLRSDHEMFNRHLIAVYVRMFLEKRESKIENFQTEFSRLTVVDEKIDLFEEFMGNLMNELRAGGISNGMVDWQLEEARISIERILLQRLYRQVMFPNDDGDISRDEVLREHIRKLQKVITPSHSNLRIPQEYLSEAPWPFAQQQISYISAYKTPREKLQCVVRCISSIMNLLQIACDRIPAADDLIPVLIYVVIKANPPYLLSTIQYVNCFIGDTLDGKDLFHWTQFCSVVQFIKTMDYAE